MAKYTYSSKGEKNEERKQRVVKVLVLSVFLFLCGVIKFDYKIGIALGLAVLLFGLVFGAFAIKASLIHFSYENDKIKLNYSKGNRQFEIVDDVQKFRLTKKNLSTETRIPYLRIEYNQKYLVNFYQHEDFSEKEIDNLIMTFEHLMTKYPDVSVPKIPTN